MLAAINFSVFAAWVKAQYQQYPHEGPEGPQALLSRAVRGRRSFSLHQLLSARICSDPDQNKCPPSAGAPQHILAGLVHIGDAALMAGVGTYARTYGNK